MYSISASFSLQFIKCTESTLHKKFSMINLSSIFCLLLFAIVTMRRELVKAIKHTLTSSLLMVSG